jgi:Flp pilus assembly protein TadD
MAPGAVSDTPVNDSAEVDVSAPGLDATSTQLGVAEQLLASGDCATATDVLAGLRAANPDDIEVLRMLGSALYECGRVEEVIPVLQRALELEPEDTLLLLLLGSARQELDDAEGARESYLRYLALEPTGAHADEVRYILERL